MMLTGMGSHQNRMLRVSKDGRVLKRNISLLANRASQVFIVSEGLRTISWYWCRHHGGNPLMSFQI